MIVIYLRKYIRLLIIANAAIALAMLTGCQTFKLTEGFEVVLLEISYHKHDHKKIEVSNEKSKFNLSSDDNPVRSDNPFVRSDNE